MAAPPDVHSFREKLDRELKSGLVSLLLLLVIDRVGPEYGYRILRRIEEASGGQLAFKEGTAYPLLHNLEEMGFISSFWGEGEKGPPRKYYQVTTPGQRAIEQGLEDWRALTESVEQVVEALETDAAPSGDGRSTT